MSEQKDLERAEFENHPRFKGMDFSRSDKAPEYYESPYANGAFDGWMAARSLPVGVPDGEQLKAKVLELIGDECKYWQGKDEARRGGFAILYSKVNELDAAPNVKAEQAQAGADWVMRLLDTGEWHLTRFRNDPSMTEDYCRRNSWQVERQCAPYCGDNDVTFWRAETAEQAFIAAINDLFPERLAEFGQPAPSLPAAGSAVEGVEVRGLQWLDTGHYRKNPPQFGYNPHDWNPLMTVAQHKRIVAALSAQQSAQPEFCCKHSYKVAKQAAWGARDLTQCKCDHNEYCEHCWPDDFKEGGKWYNGFEAQQSAPERVSVPVELLDSATCLLELCDMDGPTYRELRALLASHAEVGRYES